MIRIILLATRGFLFLFLTQQVHAYDVDVEVDVESSCDLDFITVDGASLIVFPTESDDTANIQCALDSAIEQDIAMVQLAEGDFNIGAIEAAGFNGRLSGISKGKTRLLIGTGEVDCSAMEEAGLQPAGIRFSGGSPRIQNMTIYARYFCDSSPSVRPVVIHFTGQPTGTSECSNDVIFGVVDRVNLSFDLQVDPFAEETPSFEKINGISGFAEGFSLGGCKQTLLGTLKVNRSELDGFYAGFGTSMRGGAQIDVNYNTFTNNEYDTVFVNSNQSTYIVGNQFNGTPDENFEYFAVKVETSSDTAPATTKFVLLSNTFSIDAQSTTDLVSGFAVLFDQSAKTAEITALIAQNTFTLSGDGAYGVVDKGVSGGVIAKNVWRGTANAAISLGALGGYPSVDWAILANRGFSGLETSTADIALGAGATGTVIGAGQGATVIDLGEYNSAL